MNYRGWVLLGVLVWNCFWIKGQELLHLPHFSEGEDFGYISCLATDRKNNLWIGTREQGLIVYRPETETWQQIIPADTIRWITALTIDSRNNKWIGTPSSGLLLVDEAGNFIERYPIFRPDSSSQHLINALVVDYDNVVWVGTADGGLWAYDGQTWEVYTQEGEFLPTNTITSLTVDRYNNKWIGTRLGLWATTVGKVWDQYDVYSEVRDIFADGVDNICTCVFDRRRLEWIHCTNQLYQAVNKSTKKDFFNLRQVVIDKNLHIWAAAAEGIVHFIPENEKKGHWETLKAYDGGRATVIDLDQTGRYAWVGTETAGIFRIDLDIPPAQEDILFDDLLLAIDKTDSAVAAFLQERQRINEQSKDTVPEVAVVVVAQPPKVITEDLPPDMPKPPSKKVKLRDTEMSEGEAITLSNINFAPRSAELTDKAGLEEIYRFLLLNPNVTVELGGHTDRDPATSHPNYERIRQQHKQLSLERAKSVAQFLIQKGIPAERLQTQGYGGSQPLFAYNSSQNRRVELKIIQIK